VSGEQTLLPCPFCGTVARDDEQEFGLPAWLQLNEIAGPLFSVECFGCGIEMRYADSADEAIAAWNRRHPADAFRAGFMTFNEARAAQGLPTLPGDPKVQTAPVLLDAECLAVAELKNEILGLIDGSAGYGSGLRAYPKHPDFGQQKLYQICESLVADGLVERVSEEEGGGVLYAPKTATANPWICTGWFPGRHFDLRGIASNPEKAAAIFGFCGDEPYTFEEVHLVLGNRCVAFTLTEPQIAKVIAAGGRPC
jgi:restriction alleviation protein Lar